MEVDIGRLQASLQKKSNLGTALQNSQNWESHGSLSYSRRMIVNIGAVQGKSPRMCTVRHGGTSEI